MAKYKFELEDKLNEKIGKTAKIKLVQGVSFDGEGVSVKIDGETVARFSPNGTFLFYGQDHIYKFKERWD